ncbi:MAG TPA: histidine kinase [Clostridia bacterium]|nr:histidine kinase [Clostridia bacterium]
MFAFVGTTYYNKFDTVKKLQQSWNALNAVCNYYVLKQTSLPDIILPFYQTDDNNFRLDTMLRSPTDEVYSDPINKMEMYNVLKKIADFDGDIKEILLYKEINGSKYVYLRKDKTIEAVSAEYPFFDVLANQKSGRVITGTRRTSSGDKVNSEAVYGVGGVVGMDKDAGVAGKFLIAFNTEAIERVYQGYSEIYGRFVLISPTGDVIYDTDGIYDGKKFLHIDEVLSGKDTAVIDGVHCYIQTVGDSKASVIGVNIVPKNMMEDKRFSLLVYGAFTLMAIICAAFYMIGGHFISRRIKELEIAMKRVGSNNFSYRIPISKQSDEFEEIAVKFNEMCDELQITIEREYISEIKKKNAELGSLQAGINPHFLYNTLEVIRVKAIDAGNKDVAKMIVNLANLYRSVVRDCTFIPMRSEINICDMYMDIFSFRYDIFLDYEMNIDPQIMEFGIPKNLLQPIIENYFVHGIKDGCYTNHFEIRGFLTNGDICFIFEDNGRGISKEQLDETIKNINAVKPEVESGYGLLNIQKRIRLIYGEPFGITLESEENKMTRITVLIKAMTCDALEASLSSAEKLIDR